MMIKKFSEFIEEGMWGSALKRSNSGKERKDDEANRIQEFIDNQPESEYIYITDGNVINSKKSPSTLPNLKGSLPFIKSVSLITIDFLLLITLPSVI